MAVNVQLNLTNKTVHREEESELVRRMERIRRRKERREMLGGGGREEREDGEHSPSPEPERPHHRYE